MFDINKTLGLMNFLERNKINILKKLSSNFNSSSVLLRELWKELDSLDDYLKEIIKNNIADNPNTPIDILEVFLNDDSEKVRRISSLNLKRIKEDNNQSELLDDGELEELISMSKSKDKDIRNEVAYYHKTPPFLLEKLSTDKTIFVKLEVADNPNTPSETLRKMSFEKSIKIKTSVFENPNTPLDIVNNLYKEVYTEIYRKENK